MRPLDDASAFVPEPNSLRACARPPGNAGIGRRDAYITNVVKHSSDARSRLVMLDLRCQPMKCVW
jgi:hypothetical protein